MRTATGARVRVIDPLPHAPERAAIVSSPRRDASVAALLRLHDGHTAARHAVDVPSAASSARYLICRSQAGALIGRGGAGLADLRARTGAVVFVHPPHDLPPAALVTDRLVTISGNGDAVRTAVTAVCGILADNPPTARPGVGVPALPAASLITYQPPPPPTLYPPPPVYYPPWPPPRG